MKSSTLPNFDIENSKIKLIFQKFLSSSSFLSGLDKNVLKNGSKMFFSDFHEICDIT